MKIKFDFFNNLSYLISKKNRKKNPIIELKK